jgi:hypothetical protein
MVRPTTLSEPWRSLAERLGGAGALYQALHEALGCSLHSAHRVCQGTGQLNYDQWCTVAELFRRHRVPLIL